MKTLNDHFSAVVCINLARRTDRWEHVQQQCREFGFTVERFEAHDARDCPMDGRVNGNFACTASHRGVLELICHNRWETCLILEDDFDIVDVAFNEMLEAMMPEVPTGWDVLYLGGHYAEAPITRVAPSVIRCGRMHTTSSYAVSLKHARRMAPYIFGNGPIDVLVSGFNRDVQAFILQPRLCVQYENYSDLQERVMENASCMQDTFHENLV